MTGFEREASAEERASLPVSHYRGLLDRLVMRLVTICDSDGRFLQPLADGRIIDTKSWDGWDWPHGVALHGLWRLHELTGDAQPVTIITDWFENQWQRGSPTRNINSVAPMLTLANMAALDPQPRFRAHLENWAEYLVHDLPRTDEGGFQHIVFQDENRQQLWDDTLFMSALPLARIGTVLGRPSYVAEALRQFLLHVKYLADRRTGLWFHGWTFEGHHHFAEALWARGNCWITIAIPEIIEMLELQPGDPIREFLVETLRAQVHTLAALQNASGLWHTLLDEPESYLEASATAGFAAGILKGVRLGLLDPRHIDCGMRALKGVIAHISDDGELLQTSFGTGMGRDLQFYRDIPLTPMPYGQSLAMLALIEGLRRVM